MNWLNTLKKALMITNEADRHIKKPNPIIKFIDNVFLSKIFMAPVWFYGLIAGVILNGSTNIGMNESYWNGHAWLGDDKIVTYTGTVLIWYGAVGLLYFILRVTKILKP